MRTCIQYMDVFLFSSSHTIITHCGITILQHDTWRDTETDRRIDAERDAETDRWTDADTDRWWTDTSRVLYMIS